MSDLVVMAVRDVDAMPFGLRLKGPAGSLFTVPAPFADRFRSEFGPAEPGTTSRRTFEPSPFRILDPDIGARLLAERDAALEAARVKAQARAQAEQAERERLAANEAEYEALAAAVRAAVEEQ